MPQEASAHVEGELVLSPARTAVRASPRTDRRRADVQRIAFLTAAPCAGRQRSARTGQEPKSRTREEGGALRGSTMSAGEAGMEQRDAAAVGRGGVLLPGPAARSGQEARALAAGRGGMSTGAANDDDLLSVADIINEALAIIAATDEAPSPDDECDGTEAGNGAARRGTGRHKSWYQWVGFSKRVAQGKAYVSCAIDFGQPWSGACAPRSWSACTASTTPPRRTTR